MYAFSADTYTIRQKETPKAESLQEQRLKTSLKAGCARHAEWESNISRKRNKDSAGLQSGPPRLAEQEYRQMLRSLAVALTSDSPTRYLTVNILKT